MQSNRLLLVGVVVAAACAGPMTPAPRPDTETVPASPVVPPAQDASIPPIMEQPPMMEATPPARPSWVQACTPQGRMIYALSNMDWIVPQRPQLVAIDTVSGSPCFGPEVGNINSVLSFLNETTLVGCKRPLIDGEPQAVLFVDLESGVVTESQRACEFVEAFPGGQVIMWGKDQFDPASIRVYADEASFRSDQPSRDAQPGLEWGWSWWSSVASGQNIYVQLTPDGVAARGRTGTGTSIQLDGQLHMLSFTDGQQSTRSLMPSAVGSWSYDPIDVSADGRLFMLSTGDPLNPGETDPNLIQREYVIRELDLTTGAFSEVVTVRWPAGDHLQHWGIAAEPWTPQAAPPPQSIPI